MKRLLIIAFLVVTGLAVAQRPASKAAKSTAPVAVQAPASGLASEAPLPTTGKTAGTQGILPSAQAPEASISSATAAAPAPAAKSGTLPSAQAAGSVTTPNAPEGK